MPDVHNRMLWRPPHYVAADDDDAQEADPVYPDHPLESCLLDRNLYMDTRTNATTTHYELKDPDGKRADIVIQVSLFVARPPRVSTIQICCAGTRFTQQPVVLATFGGLVLLSIALSRYITSESEFFLYRPGGGAPSLCLIPPQPCLRAGLRFEAQHHAACILPHPHGGNDGDYLITALVDDIDTGELHLFLYSSRTQTWTVRRTDLMPPVPAPLRHLAYKAIPVCGGSMVAFVDLWTGILFCDVLDGEERPKLHHLPLPSTGFSRESRPHVSTLWVPRDVLIQKVPGSSGAGDLLRIRFVEVVCQPAFESWRVTSWSTTVATTTPWCQLKDWLKHEDVSHLDLSVTNGVCYDGLPPAEEDGKPALGSLYLDRPAMSSHQDNVVCFIAKNYSNRFSTWWTIAIDMANKMLQGVYRCDRFTTELSDSTISSHVDMTARPVVKGDGKRLGPQLESYPHKKIYHEQMVTSPVDEQQQGIMATQDGDDMDLDQE